MTPAVRLQSISPDATPEEVAAIVAAIAVLEAEGAATGGGDAPEASAWVRASRLSGRRAGLQRGSWRLSGRIGRRSRA